MSGAFRSLLGRFARRLRNPLRLAPADAEPDDTGPRHVDIVLSDLPADWVQSLESADASTDYDVRSLGEPIDPTFPRR